MTDNIRLTDAVALLSDIPEKGLIRGQVGTVVESLATDVFEVEFSDSEGHTYAFASISSDQLLVLHYEPDRTAILSLQVEYDPDYDYKSERKKR